MSRRSISSDARLPDRHIWVGGGACFGRADLIPHLRRAPADARPSQDAARVQAPPALGPRARKGGRVQTDNHGRDADPAAGTLLLTRSDVLATLDPKTCIEAVEQAFRMHGERRTLGPAMLGVHVPGGGFHVKAAGLLLDRKYFAAKTNANFPDNGRRFGLPTIQGTVVLCDADDGRPLALMDSMALTALRTAAATAVAAKHLARREARSVALGGCGVQAAAQLDALAALIPISIVYVVDLDAARATRFAAETAARLDLAVEVRGDLHAAALAADIVVTCTSSREAIL